MNSVPRHLLSEDRQEFEGILDEALRSGLYRRDLPAFGSAAVREEVNRPASSTPPSIRESDTSSSATGHHGRAVLGPRVGVDAVRAGRVGDHRIGNGVVAHRWARMSWGRRLLAAVFGLHVRPDVPKTAGAAGERTPPQETTQATRSSAVAVFAVPATVLSGAITAISFLAGLVLKMFASGKVAARPMFSAGWAFGSLTVGMTIICMIVLLVTTLRKRPSIDAGPYREERPQPPAARESISDTIGQRLTPEQLRTMALNASALITAAAATEYQHYVKVREELRRPASSAPPSARGSGSEEPGAVGGLAATAGEAAEAGAGVGAVAAVLTPLLGGTAAVIFLLAGYIVRAQTMIITGWVFAAVTAAAIVAGAVGLLLTALRTQSSPESRPYGELNEEVARAREAWRQALLERGIMPFLREALAEPGTSAALHSRTPPTPTSRMPRLGYDRPGFSRPDDGSAPGPRPSFTSPDFASPDFGGPERQSE